MAIAKKPKLNPSPAIDESAIHALINKGGSVAVRESDISAGPFRLQLRLDAALVSRIDSTRKKRLVTPPRHAWLLEAIHEKLQREESKDT